MDRRTDGALRTTHAARALARRVALVVVCLGAARSVAAQDPEPLFERFNLDKLQLVSLGASVGRILPSQVEPTTLFAGSADYGEITKNWHIVFGISYWESRYRDNVVRTFIDSLEKSLDPPGQAIVNQSRINLYDATFSAEGRYMPTYSGELKPFLGLGFAAHVINAEGRLINGTFIERSLDNIAAGVYLTGGVGLRVLRHFGLEGAARADLLSGFRSTQLRAGGVYYFGRVRSTQPTPPPGSSSGGTESKS